MFAKITIAIRDNRRRRALQGMREHLARFGHDTSGLSDEELEARLMEANRQFAEGLRRISVSAQQAAESLFQFARAAQLAHDTQN